MSSGPVRTRALACLLLWLRALALAAGVGRGLPAAGSPADRVERGSDVSIGVGVYAAGNGTCLYDGQGHPFLRLRGGTHPLAVGPVNPGLFHRTGRSDRHAGGCQKTWARPTSRFAGQPERRQPNRRAGRSQAPEPTPTPDPSGGSRAGSTIHT